MKTGKTFLMPDFGYGSDGLVVKLKDAKEEKEKSLKSMRISERMAMLGIPDGEMTESVSLAVSALLEKLEDTTRDLARTREQLTELEQLVDVDVLAPIANRRAFMRRLAWAIAMFERYGHPVSILYFDLNDFKGINDTYGHAAGDAAISHVAKTLAASMRDSDFLARLHGDEFAIIMYHAGKESTEQRGNAMVEKIRSHPMSLNGKQIYLNAAVGGYTVQKGDDAEAALSAADTAMFVNKKRGKSGTTSVRA